MASRIGFLAMATFLAVATGFAASAGAASSKSPFCFAGSPTPKHICSTIKANSKPQRVKQQPQRVRHGTTESWNGQRR